MIQRRKERPPVTNDLQRMIEGQVASLEATRRQTLRDWQAKSLEERGEGVIACCQSAAAVMETRRQMGMEPMQRTPWPKHIWDMLRRHATEARNASHDAT